MGGGESLVAFVCGVGRGRCGVGEGRVALFAGVGGGRWRGWSLGGRDLLGEGAAEFVVFFVFRCWRVRGSSVVGRICESFENKNTYFGMLLDVVATGFAPVVGCDKSFLPFYQF